MEVAPDDGYNLALRFDCDSIADPTRFLDEISHLKRHIFGGPLDNALSALQAKNSANVPLMSIEYRKNEMFFICPAPAKVVVIFLVDFADPTDKAIARVFLQEFAEAQRSMRSAPPVMYSKEPPLELAGIRFNYSPECVGFLSFALENRHVEGERKETVITMLTSFRNYLHYHIKCSKTYLHMRMRKRGDGWMQVLNRAMPEVETEKKTMSGKSFNRK